MMAGPAIVTGSYSGVGNIAGVRSDDVTGENTRIGVPFGAALFFEAPKLGTGDRYFKLLLTADLLPRTSGLRDAP